MSFEELGLDARILRGIEEAGYEHPTPIQMEAIPCVMQQRDVLGCAQTGTGKTAAFALPIIHHLVANPVNWTTRNIRALILAPTRELAVQIGDCFKKYAKRTKVRHTVILGGVNQTRQIVELEKGVDVVIATPGRLLDLIDQGYVELNATEILVLDEADHMLDMGFLPDVKSIIRKVPKDRQTLFFSATMPDDIRKLADEILINPARLSIRPELPAAERVEQQVYFVSQKGKPFLLANLIKKDPSASVLVFVRTKYSADAVAKKLARFEISSDALHGNKSQNKRQRILGEFKAGQLQVLVATDIAARGIDVRGISHVFNYDMPNVAETYVHRIGRTGRAGESGIAISFCNHEERKNLDDVQKYLRKKIPVMSLPEGLEIEHDEPAARPEESQGRRNSRPAQQRNGNRPSPRSGNRSNAGRSKSPTTAKSSAPRSTASQKPTAAKPVRSGSQSSPLRKGRAGRRPAASGRL